MIEKNIPVPPPHKTGVTALLRELQIGESRLIPEVSGKVYSLAYRVLGKGNFRAHKEHGGTRIWRIA